jgi:hypothetical protein
MNEKMKALKRISLVFFLGIVAIAVVKTNGQEETKAVTGEQWEYLVVAGPSLTNLTPTGNPRMRKEPNVPFAREAFVFEQHLDKLGTNGWELVAISGPANDPSFYFKRRK